ncbi:MAG: Lin0512 family protein [Pseudomonadales bacterium]
MPLNRYVTEMGMGVDVHGGDYTKAAKRAVSDALRHSSLNFFRVLDKQVSDMHITVKIGAQQPDQVDIHAVAGEVPYGHVTVQPEVGGLDVRSSDNSDVLVMVNAAILVHFDDA